MILPSVEIVASSLPVVNTGGLLDGAYKTAVFNIHLTEPQKRQLHDQDFLYNQLQEQENVEDLQGDYLQEKVKG